MQSENVIHLLSELVIDQIKAGEVVDRPASVIKELVENSYDAGATHIEVDIEAGGLDRIIVRDNGSGMGADNVTKCFLRHATSKLRGLDDLNHLVSMGFRGEALAAITSVSKVRITTRLKGSDRGCRINLEGGNLLETTKAGCPEGTTIVVEDLFFNTPVRKKFLKSRPTEQAHVQEACIRVALGARRGSLILRSNGRRLLDIPNECNQQLRVAAALNYPSKKFLPLLYSDEGVQVSGFISQPEVSRGDTKGIWTFVNGRFVRDRMLQRAILDAFRGRYPDGRYPLVVLYIDLEPDSIDVNVHPQKLEVRFDDGATVFRCMSAALASVGDDSLWNRGQFEAQEHEQKQGGEAPAEHRRQVLKAVRNFYYHGKGRSGSPRVKSGKGGSRFNGDNREGDQNSTLPLFRGPSTEPKIDSTFRKQPNLFPMVMPESEGGGQRDEEERVIRLSSRHNLVSFKARYYLVDENKLRRAYIWRSFCEGFPYSDASRVQLMLPLVLELSKEAIPLLDEYPSFLMKMGLEFDQVGPARYLLRTNPQGIALKEPEMLERLLTKIPSVGPLSADFDLMELGVLIAECADVSGVRHSDAELVALELKQEGSSVPSELKGHQLLSDDILERLIHFD